MSTIEFRFDCPSCGEPWARVTSEVVDVHYGSTYECADCGEPVIFAAYSVEGYRQLHTPEGLHGAREEPR